MPKISEKQKDWVRNEIYEAAVRVIEESGVDAATMSKVAEEAGAAKGSLYNYFADKSELLEYVFNRTIEPLDAEVDSIIESDHSSTEQLRAILYAVFHYIDSKRKLFDFLLGQHEIHRLCSARNSSGPPFFEQLIAKAVEQGEFRECDPEFHAALIYGAIHGVADNYVKRDGPWPVFEIVDSIWKFFLKGLQAPD
ncbi:MAG: hypothetical protein CMJ58_01425 [Planctomycetaceae bacterium]|nr:hypothetical protein [Planctomycetaceae bacterium]